MMNRDSSRASSPGEGSADTGSEKGKESAVVVGVVSPSDATAYRRTIPPFLWAHDLPRGLLYAGHALLGYLLMLAVM